MTTSQVDQEWPLFCHLITTGPHSWIWKSLLHIFMLILHFVSGILEISTLFDTSLKESALKCWHFLYTSPLLIHSCSVLFIHSSRISELFWHSITRKCQGVFSQHMHSCPFSTLPTKMGLQHSRHPTRKCHEVLALLIHFPHSQNTPVPYGLFKEVSRSILTPTLVHFKYTSVRGSVMQCLHSKPL